MLQIRSIVLRGNGVKDASVSFGAGGNILAGASDTGKSYLIHCLDYILGADEMRKRIDEAEPYSQLFVEFENHRSEILTLERSLGGGNLAAYNVRIEKIVDGTGEVIVPKRTGKSQAKDVTQILFAFAGIAEAELRKNDRGEVNRLTIRTILPLFLIDEVSVIEERSPILGKTGFDATARKRAFAYMLSGKDDSGIIASEKKELVSARINAKLSVISDLLDPIEKRLSARSAEPATETIERVDRAISELSAALSSSAAERSKLEAEHEEATKTNRRAESQIIAVDELLKQYALLGERYRTDLERLDFIAEGSHFFDGLQAVSCPLCDQLMSPDHVHKAEIESGNIYEAARSEASKILAHQADLKAATQTLTKLREARNEERNSARATITRVDSHIEKILIPAMQDGDTRLDLLVSRRIQLETFRSDETQASDLRTMKSQLEQATVEKTSTGGWEPLPASALRTFCVEVEKVLKDWKWKGECRVEFDETEYDIKVDGQRRQSHGKGVRAVLHSAFVIGLLRYCQANKRPHLGTVVIDSPLTSYKKGKTSEANEQIDAGIEAAFWNSLRSVATSIQLIIIENKEPPSQVASSVHYEWFAGEGATAAEREGYIPS